MGWQSAKKVLAYYRWELSNLIAEVMIKQVYGAGS